MKQRVTLFFSTEVVSWRRAFVSGSDRLGWLTELRLLLLVFDQFVEAFGKLRKATVSFSMSACPSFHIEQLGSY
jgi:hypothetical protein